MVLMWLVGAVAGCNFGPESLNAPDAPAPVVLSSCQNRFQGTECRGVDYLAQPCDRTEFCQCGGAGMICDAAHAACPADDVLPSGFVCFFPDDRQGTCDGVSRFCQAIASPPVDASVPDAPVVVVDASLPDARLPDAAIPDARLPDATIVVDARPPDASLPDARPPDAAIPDARLPDATIVVDARPPDASPPDATVPDATPPDARLPDATPPLLVNGATCTVGTQCVSGFCADGTCCESACSGECMYCGNSFGICALFSGGTDPQDECVGAGSPDVCNGAGECVAPCLVDADCNDASFCTVDTCVTLGRFCQNTSTVSCSVANTSCNPATAICSSVFRVETEVASLVRFWVSPSGPSTNISAVDPTPEFPGDVDPEPGERAVSTLFRMDLDGAMCARPVWNDDDYPNAATPPVAMGAGAESKALTAGGVWYGTAGAPTMGTVYLYRCNEDGSSCVLVDLFTMVHPCFWTGTDWDCPVTNPEGNKFYSDDALVGVASPCP
ncbi:MAG: hypothetical protein AAB348_03490 [Patescibacteria group bacterium]